MGMLVAEPSLLWLLAFSLIGVLLGTATGIIPGIHPNNVALILLSLLPALSHPLSAFLPAAPVLLASLLLAASITHTFLSFIPAAFVGAPEGDTALCVLPAHHLLLEGRAYEAVKLSAAGGFLALICSFLFLMPFKFFLSHMHFYEFIRAFMPYILIGISLLLILTESFTEIMEPFEAILASSAVFTLSGIFGMLILNFNLHSPFFNFSINALFPALTGLFGLSTLLFSLAHTPEIPSQKKEEVSLEINAAFKSAAVGSASGTLVSFLPGVTAAHATVLAMLLRKERSPEHVILTLSAVNTANAIFCLATLFILMKARSGIALAIQEIMPIYAWNASIPPTELCFLLISAIFAGVIAYFLTIFIGKNFASLLERIPYKLFLLLTVISLVALTFILSGMLGVLVLAVATSIGLLPIYAGVKRSNCMGVLLLPVIIFYMRL